MRILFLVSAHNSLSQRACIELSELGHEVTVAVGDSPESMEAAVAAHGPQLIVCPMLKKLIPESVWSRHRCLVVHPGPPGDRGPSSLDWAIEVGADAWGVTVLEANGEPDAGTIWASRTFRTRPAGRAACIATRCGGRRSMRSSKRSGRANPSARRASSAGRARS